MLFQQICHPQLPPRPGAAETVQDMGRQAHRHRFARLVTQCGATDGAHAVLGQNLGRWARATPPALISACSKNRRRVLVRRQGLPNHFPADRFLACSRSLAFLIEIIRRPPTIRCPDDDQPPVQHPGGDETHLPIVAPLVLHRSSWAGKNTQCIGKIETARIACGVEFCRVERDFHTGLMY